MRIQKRGALFYIVHANGKTASIGYAQLEDAQEHLGALMRQTQRSVRSCMSCQKTFESEGTHNRMCPQCKRRA
jgi:tRNA(Ile2) C34 agmatinyltransferase TiaS